MLVGGFDDLVVSDRAARLDDRGDADVDGRRFETPTSLLAWLRDETHDLWAVGPESGGRALDSAEVPEIVLPEAPPDTEAPTPPKNLQFVSSTHDSVTLKWEAATDNVGVVGYDIYQHGQLVTSVGNAERADYAKTMVMYRGDHRRGTPPNV